MESPRQLAVAGVRALRERFDVGGFFYNPNIHPREEFRKRLLRVQVLFPAGEIDKQININK